MFSISFQQVVRMIYLLVVSLVWGFSFGLIKGNLTGLDSNFVSCARMAISLFIFLPFMRLPDGNRKLALRLILIGMVQFGIMYIAYIYSFKFLKAYEVALFTIFTPVYVTLINDAFRRKINKIYLAAAALAVAGAAVVTGSGAFGSSVLQGGQVAYKKALGQSSGVQDRNVFGWLYLGAFLVTTLAAGVSTAGKFPQLTQTHILTLLYLGIVASGVSFFLWNYGARKVEVGTLAVFNNLKIPLAIAISLLFFGESANLPNLIGGGLLIVVAILLAEISQQRQKQPNPA
jgi:drug/metabolite transporter (DMT)-like permease